MSDLSCRVIVEKADDRARSNNVEGLLRPPLFTLNGLFSLSPFAFLSTGVYIAVVVERRISQGAIEEEFWLLVRGRRLEARYSDHWAYPRDHISHCLPEWERQRETPASLLPPLEDGTPSTCQFAC